MNMIEKVARVITNNYGFRCSIGANCHQCKMNDLDSIVKAKAATEAMREPTEGMIDVANKCRYDVSHISNYKKIIDAALQEE